MTAAIPSISPEEFNKLRAQSPNVFILDVRNPSEYREDNLNGYLIPLAELPHRLHELPEKDRLIIVHCQHGVRSQHAVALLRREGYQNCLSLSGGLSALRAAT